MKRIITRYLPIALLLLGAVLPACNRNLDNKPTITVSIQPQKYFLEKIAGDKWEVKCLLSNGANPESYDPAMTHLLNLESSKAYFRMGNIPFESAIINKVHNNNPALKIYNNSEGIELITGTHSHGDIKHADAPDPHTWTSVKNARIIATNMYNAMSDLDPKHKDTYSRNYLKVLESLDSLDSSIDSLLAPKRGESFVVWHPSLSYFARDYGLHQISLSPEGKEASVNMLQEAVDSARTSGARVVFYQKEIDSRQAETANRQIGATMVNINPLSYNWDKEIYNIANAIAEH
ncbi:zinc ABC transporter substrate-binding protein [Barnesiella sp. WM24]|uniref:metal ABC transporter solute-binding protein, Zn/Mn family n=1 Tax=Barnesiella sp. WM24 TaxID=2558278 RepID=UPI0010724175|nr:zinc ABC transporter substrate-binding protein [Barnesiella sp. WM24]MDE6115863.1 zinc ABC transporter substrate-binding protein [Muribaculum sp.]TFU95165.1 zinc ABC transporter substrate-binding protein [Barnesiella sp. WM24]